MSSSSPPLPSRPPRHNRLPMPPVTRRAAAAAAAAAAAGDQIKLEKEVAAFLEEIVGVKPNENGEYDLQELETKLQSLINNK